MRNKINKRLISYMQYPQKGLSNGVSAGILPDIAIQRLFFVEISGMILETHNRAIL
jgi:hypothetical protein